MKRAVVIDGNLPENWPLEVIDRELERVGGLPEPFEIPPNAQSLMLTLTLNRAPWRREKDVDV